MTFGRQYPAPEMGAVAGFSNRGIEDASPPELGILRGMLDDARAGHPRTVLVQGERGIGKTSLLRQLTADLSDTQVVSARGEESEIGLRYGLLEHLVRSVDLPLPDELAALLARTRPEPEIFAVGHSLLRLLVALQQAMPVLVVVDDADLADDASQVALLFALRRLHDSKVLTVLAAREPARLPEGIHKLVSDVRGATVTVTGLGSTAIRRLSADLVGRNLPCRFVQRLREHTGGNPALVRGVLEALDDSGIEEVGDGPLPAPPSSRSLAIERLARCGPAGRRLAAAAAVLGERCPFAQVRELSGVDEPLHALQAGIDAGLVEYRSRDVVFVHPLLRAAVYHQLGVSERAELHRRAAHLVTEEGARLRHLSAATVDHDDDLAASIAGYAARTAAGGSTLAASAQFVDAAALVPSGSAREAYAFGAVDCLLAAGDAAGAGVVATRLVGEGRGPMALAARGRLALVAGQLEAAERLLVEARDAAPADDADLRAGIDEDLVRVSVEQLRPSEAACRTDAALRLPDGAVARHRSPARAWALGLAGRATEALALFDPPAEGLAESDPATADLLLGAAVAKLFTGAARDARELAARQVRMAARFGRAPLRLCGLATLSLAEYRLGAWSDATAHAEQGAAIADAAGPGLPRTMLHLAAVLPLAGRGQWAAAEAHEAMAADTAVTPFEQALAGMARVALAHARGQHGKVVEAVAALRGLGERGAVDAPGGPWPWQEPLVEALIGLGRLDDAEEVLVQFERLAKARGSLGATAAAARLRGSLEAARGRERLAHVAFAHAMEVGAEVSLPFDRARTHADCGAFLRRAGKRTAAVAALKSARECFDRLGAGPYLARCDRELAAAGLTPRRRTVVSTPVLTPQELSVAELVAQGKTNREVAGELVVSVNTVEYHLKNIYAKLGISSRSQLTLRYGAIAAAAGLANN